MGTKWTSAELRQRFVRLPVSGKESIEHHEPGAAAMTNTENVKKPAKTPRVDMPLPARCCAGAQLKEVALGYSLEQAQLEASRCLQCKNPRAAVRGVRLKSVFPNSSLRSSRVT